MDTLISELSGHHTSSAVENKRANEALARAGYLIPTNPCTDWINFSES